MAGSDPLTGILSTTDTATLAQQQAKLAEGNGMSDAIADRMQNMRSESLATSRFLSQQESGDITKSVTVGPARVDDTSTASGPANVSTSESMQTLDTLSEMSWRMVSFSFAAGTMEKTDKSAKMFIQAQ